jgi:hypothetical protein
VTVDNINTCSQGILTGDRDSSVEIEWAAARRIWVEQVQERIARPLIGRPDARICNGINRYLVDVLALV